MINRKNDLSPALNASTTTRRSCLAAVMCCIMALSACSSTPMHYYTLQTPALRSADSSNTAPFALHVLPVGVPPQLDNANLVVREGASETKVFDTLRWSANFSDEVRTALSATLTDTLQSQDVAGLQAPAGKPVVMVKVQIRRLDATLGQGVYADVDWSLRLQKDSGASGLLCHAVLTQAAPGDYSALVAAEQSALHALSMQIARTARQWFASPSSGCAI